MKMMKSILLFSSFLAIILFLSSAGCNSIKELEYKGIKNPKLQTLSFNNTAIQMDLVYFNPNNFGLDVKETNLNIYLNDKFVGIADQPSKTQIAKNSTFLFPIVTHFDALKVLGTAFKALFSKTNKVTIQGSAKIGKGGIYIKLPVNISENVSLY
jgi:LEA14-like dessication related protein